MAVIESPLSKALQGGLIQKTVASSSVFAGSLRLNPINSGIDFQTLKISNQNASDIISLKDQVRNLQQQVYSLFQQNTKLITELSQISVINNQISNIQSSINFLSNQNNNLIANFDEIYTFKKIIDNLQYQINSFQKQITIVNEKNINLTAEVNKITIFKNKIYDLENQIQIIQKQIYSLTEQNLKLFSDVVQINSLKNTIINLQNQIAFLNNSVFTIASKPKESNTENLKLQSEIVENKNTTLLLQKQVNNLQDQNRQIILGVSNNITQIQKQVNGLQEQIGDFSSGLERISAIIVNTSLLDQQKSQYENEKERKSAEIGLRRGKEKALENRIQSALSEPVKRIGGKLQLGLNNLLQGLYWIFGGWLTNQVINLLTAYSQKDWQLFDKIKEAIVRNTLIAIRGLAFIKGGISKLIGGIFSFSKMIAKFLIVNPIKALFKGASSLLGGGKAAKTAEAGVEAAGKIESKVLGEGAEVLAKRGGGKLLGRFVPGLSAILGGASAIQNVMEGDVPGALLDVGSMLPGPVGWGFLAASLGYETMGPGAKLAEERSTGISVKDQKTQRKQSQVSPQQTTIPPIVPTLPTAKPKESMVQSQSAMMKQNILSSPSMGSDTVPIESTPMSKLKPDVGSFGVDTLGQFKTVDNLKDNRIALAQTQNIPSPSPPGPEPPAKPNIIYTQTGASQPQIPNGPEPNRSEPISDVPFILPFDTDNFYTLYSQVNYNVVST